MQEDIELAIETAAGIIDCRLEAVRDEDDALYYSATFLYPTMVNGYARTAVYCHDLRQDGSGYTFAPGEEIHLALPPLLPALNEAIRKAR